MKLPSVSYLLQNARVSLQRFPLTIAAAILATVLGIILVEKENDISNILPFLNVLLSLVLGIPLFFCLGVLSEKLRLQGSRRILLMCAGVLLLAGIGFSLPGSDDTHNTTVPYIRYLIYNLTIHLFVSFIPFMRRDEVNGFWQYNRILFLRFLASALYCGVLYIGLVIALASLRWLFDIELHEELFFEMFIVIAGLLNTWFFLSGIPRDLDGLNSLTEYPKGLRVFSQYILVPLLALYMLILYFYGGKILTAWDWPKGLVAYLVVCVSVLGIFTFLLMYPYGEQDEHRWIRVAYRGYYIALMPLVLLLFMAVLLRIDNYGITVNRYVLLILGTWLSILCIYTSLGRRNLRFIPASLAVIMLLMTFGPWSMFAVSENNQVGRLEQILKNTGMLDDGKIKNEVKWVRDSLQSTFHAEIRNVNEGRLNDSLHNEIYSIVQYLDDHHGFGRIRPWFAQNIDSMLTVVNKDKKENSRFEEAQVYMNTMGLEYSYRYEGGWDNERTFRGPDTKLIDVSKWHFVLPFEHQEYEKDGVIESAALRTGSCTLFFLRDKQQMGLVVNSDSCVLPLSGLARHLYDNYGESTAITPGAGVLRLENNFAGLRFRVQFTQMSVSRKNGEYLVDSFSGYILIAP